MRVALVNLTTTTTVGGVETFVRHLAQSLAARGIAVTLFGGRPGQTAPCICMPGVTVETLPYIGRDRWRRMPLLARQYGTTKLLERLSFAVAARAAITRGGYDIIHIHKPFDFPLAAALRRQTGARVVYSSHGRDFFPGDRRFIGALDAMSACSAYNAREVRDRYGIDATVIGNGVDVERFRPLPPDAAWRASLGIGQSPLVLWVGRLERWKGTIDAIRALALMNGGPHLAIAGGGPEERRLRDAAAALGIADRVHFLGTQANERMPRLYASSDLVIGTSFANETFGIALAEASACECAVIATDIGGFPEVVRDGESGLLVPPRDPLRLAAAMHRLLAAPDQRRRMGIAGRAFVTAHFAWPVVTDRVLALYREARNAD